MKAKLFFTSLVFSLTVITPMGGYAETLREHSVELFHAYSFMEFNRKVSAEKLKVWPGTSDSRNGDLFPALQFGSSSFAGIPVLGLAHQIPAQYYENVRFDHPETSLCINAEEKTIESVKVLPQTGEYLKVPIEYEAVYCEEWLVDKMRSDKTISFNSKAAADHFHESNRATHTPPYCPFENWVNETRELDASFAVVFLSDSINGDRGTVWDEEYVKYQEYYYFGCDILRELKDPAEVVYHSSPIPVVQKVDLNMDITGGEFSGGGIIKNN